MFWPSTKWAFDARMGAIRESRVREAGEVCGARRRGTAYDGGMKLAIAWLVATAITLSLPGAAAAGDGQIVPLRLTGTVPTNYMNAHLHRVRWGRELFFAVTTTDVAGIPALVTCGQLPRGARFEPSTREFRWTPGRDQTGIHTIELILTGENERLADKKTVRFEVAENRPPELVIHSPQKYRAGSTVMLSPQMRDPDGDPLSCEVRGQPGNATVTNAERCQIEWKTTEDDEVRTDITFAASDGMASTSKTVRIRLEEKWKSFLLPGVYYGLYGPVDRATYGVLHGTTLELVVASWVHRNDNRGPSHGRVGVKVDLLSSTREGQPVAFMYAVGVDLSFERNPSRRFLIPFFGADVGGLTQKNMGHRFQVTPRAGVYLWTNRNLFLTLAGGYMLVPGEIETLRGWRANLGLNLTLW
jgi:hypothetical protein